MKKSTVQFFQDQKKVLELLKQKAPQSGFETTIYRLFGRETNPGPISTIHGRQVRYLGLTANSASFLPTSWQEEMDPLKGKWQGCENWRAGYPLIAWVEIRDGDREHEASIKLNLEVGPLSIHKLRTKLINAIKSAALDSGLSRIRFPSGANDEGRLYSRFLIRNSVAVKSRNDDAEIQHKVVKLISDFEPELAMLDIVIRDFSREYRSDLQSFTSN